jgi:hypothetical protein
MDDQTKNNEPAGLPSDDEKELGTAEFISDSALNHLKTAIARADLANQALAAGLPGITPEMVKKINEAPALILQGICKTYPRAAVRTGSVNDKYELPQIFSNATGVEEPGDREVLKEMAAARGQTLED